MDVSSYVYAYANVHGGEWGVAPAARIEVMEVPNYANATAHVYQGEWGLHAQEKKKNATIEHGAKHTCSQPSSRRYA